MVQQIKVQRKKNSLCNSTPVLLGLELELGSPLELSVVSDQGPFTVSFDLTLNFHHPN